VLEEAEQKVKKYIYKIEKKIGFFK